ncbi:hypothetical protein FDP41_003895 [Naegleria fowleri]|uniref:Armadillo-like helical domain-containing protein n=1 Tax=Naegleria fowleri TaxID=5763 RepID=A0A6A5BRC0_NAEFO|nr:uncharacterized protein FDP41_003895 [Naegleria fowleri]KAF0977242.1 hypothetical protein FDP41_003895 [Naegleria fowleri]
MKISHHHRHHRNLFAPQRNVVVGSGQMSRMSRMSGGGTSGGTSGGGGGVVVVVGSGSYERSTLNHRVQQQQQHNTSISSIVIMEDQLSPASLLSEAIMEDHNDHELMIGESFINVDACVVHDEQQEMKSSSSSSLSSLVYSSQHLVDPLELLLIRNEFNSFPNEHQVFYSQPTTNNNNNNNMDHPKEDTTTTTTTTTTGHDDTPLNQQQQHHFQLKQADAEEYASLHPLLLPHDQFYAPLPSSFSSSTSSPLSLNEEFEEKYSSSSSSLIHVEQKNSKDRIKHHQPLLTTTGVVMTIRESSSEEALLNHPTTTTATTTGTNNNNTQAVVSSDSGEDGTKPIWNSHEQYRDKDQHSIKQESHSECSIEEEEKDHEHHQALVGRNPHQHEIVPSHHDSFQQALILDESLLLNSKVLENSQQHLQEIHDNESNGDIHSKSSLPMIRSKYSAIGFEVVEDIIEVDSRNASSLDVHEKEYVNEYSSKHEDYHCLESIQQRDQSIHTSIMMTTEHTKDDYLQQQQQQQPFDPVLHHDRSSNSNSPTHSSMTRRHTRHHHSSSYSSNSSSSLNKLIVLTSSSMKNSQIQNNNKPLKQHMSKHNASSTVMSSNNQTPPLSPNAVNHLHTTHQPSLITKSKPSKTKNIFASSSVNIPNQTSVKPSALISNNYSSNTSTFSSKLFLREWDATTQPLTRSKLLYSFVESCQHLSCRELEAKLKNYYELIFTRILGYFQLNYLHCNDLSIQIKALGLFMKEYKPLIDFIEIGGTQILLEILGFHYYKQELEDKNESLSLLTSIASNGRKFKEVICYDNGISLLKNVILYLPSSESIHLATCFFKSIFNGNPKYEKEILEMILNVFSQHSSPFNWKDMSGYLSSASTPRRNNPSIGNEITPRSSSLISPRVNPLPLTLETNNTTDSSNSPSSSKRSHWTTIIEAFKSPRGIRADDFKRSTVFDFIASPRLSANSLQQSPPQNNSPVALPTVRDSLSLSSQSLLLLYSIIREISKVVKIERLRETNIIDVLFTNLSNEDFRVVKESISIIQLSMSYQDENEVFADIILHRVIQGISMVTILLGKKRFKNLLQSLFKEEQTKKTDQTLSKQHQVKHFHHLMFGICSILNTLIEKGSRNIFKRIIETNVLLMLFESVIVIKEKYGENEYHLDGIKEMTMFFRNLVIRFEEWNMSLSFIHPRNILQQILGDEITRTLLVMNNNQCDNKTNSFQKETNFYLFLQDAIQRTLFEQVRQTSLARK